MEFKDLPPEHPPTLYRDRYAFEPARIRLFRTTQPDISSLVNIRNDPEAQKRLLELDIMTDQDLINWADDNQPEQRPKWPNLLINITDSHDNPAGFVYCYRHPHQLEKRVSRVDKITEPLRPGDLDLEISAGRNPVDENRGLISSGIRSTCHKLREIMISQGKSPDNLGLRIRAYIEPDNEASIRAFQAAGFEIKGQAAYYKGSDQKDLLLELNWQKLDQTTHRKSAEVMGKKFIPLDNSGII